MKKANPAVDNSLVEDVEDLMEKVLLEEATAQIWASFEQALQKLEPESQVVLRDFFQGTSVEEIGKKTNLSKPQVEDYVQKLKRELIENLRREFQVRQ